MTDRHLWKHNFLIIFTIGNKKTIISTMKPILIWSVSLIKVAKKRSLFFTFTFVDFETTSADHETRLTAAEENIQGNSPDY